MAVPLRHHEPSRHRRSARDARNRRAPRREHQGYVLVLENATELLRAQKQSAWKEVARRVAHEIKNPLTPISLSAEQIHRHINRLANSLADRTPTTSPAESPSIAVIRRCSEVITSSVESMRSLVDQFAALAEFPTARPKPADLNTIVENSLALFAGRMQTIRIVRQMTPNLPLVMADPEALKRALGNLIDNAAEAMQKSLFRELRISTSLLENGMVELTIADTGSGLTDEMRERLFLPYFSTKQRGTGLGLAIAAKIIQEHRAPSAPKRTSPPAQSSSSNFAQPHGQRPRDFSHRWSFRRHAKSQLPRAQIRRSSTHRDSRSPPRRSRRQSRLHHHAGDQMNHVLIVDDEAEIRESLESILREEGYLVTTAATAAEALTLLRDAAYDVVLLDIWLPDRDGLDTLTEIRQHGTRPTSPKSSSSAATAPSRPPCAPPSSAHTTSSKSLSRSTAR